MVKKNNKALIFIGTFREMQWKNITTNNPEDDIYGYFPGGGAVFYNITPGVYSLYYLKDGDRFCSYWIDKKALHEGKPAYYSFEAKVGEALYLGYIGSSGGHRDVNNLIKIKRAELDEKSLNRLNELIPRILKTSIKKVEIKEGVNDPSFYHRSCG